MASSCSSTSWQRSPRTPSASQPSSKPSPSSTPPPHCLSTTSSPAAQPGSSATPPTCNTPQQPAATHASRNCSHQHHQHWPAHPKQPSNQRNATATSSRGSSAASSPRNRHLRDRSHRRSARQEDLRLGAVLRRSAGAVTAVIAAIVLAYVLAVVAPVLPAGPADWLLRVTPAAAFAIQQSVPQYPQVTNAYTPFNGYNPLAPWAGFAVLCAWAALALGLATCSGASAFAAATTSSRNSAKRSTTCSGGLRHRLNRSGTSWPTPLTNCGPRSPRSGPCSRWHSPTQMPPRRRCDRPARRCWRWADSRNVSSRRCSPWPAVSGELSSGNPLISPRSPGMYSWSAATKASGEASTSTRRSLRFRQRVTRAW